VEVEFSELRFYGVLRSSLPASNSKQRQKYGHLAYSHITTFYNNLADAFYTPASLSYLTDPNQQYRVDIMKPGAPVKSVAPLDILDTVFSTKVGDPLAMSPYTTMTADLSPFAGKTVRLRFALVDNVAGFYGGVDNVKVTSTDTTRPTVIGLQPAATATDVSRGTNVVATFSEQMQKSTLNKANFKLYKVTATGPIQITNVTVTPNLAGTKATLNPYGSSTTLLAKNTRYKAVVTTGVKDLAANALAANKVWYFRTVS
jgi:hypothetical protein